MHQIAMPALEAVVTLNPCQAPPPVPVVTAVAPVPAHQSLYLTAAAGCLYALNAADGTVRWCQQVKLTRTREVTSPPMVSSPPPPRMAFASPRVVHDVVYVCAYGFGEYTCAFDAGDGSLRWWTPTDSRVVSMSFMEWAVPLVMDGIVYSGTYALNEQDGSVLWRIAIDTDAEGALSLHALSDETLYATTHRGIYAINAQDGQIRWLSTPREPAILSGPPIVSGRLLYAGTRGFFGYPQKSYFRALDVETGAQIWRYPMGGYIGAAVHQETIYVSSGDRCLYALDTKSGMLRWRYQFAAPGHYSAAIAENVLYIATDGAYALSNEEGAVLWHQDLGSSPTVSFGQPVVQGEAVYLARTDKRGWGVLYALNTRTGAEYWHTPYPRYSLAAPLAVAREALSSI
jgi:outer membrane protein assembly factor BamB